MKNFICLILAAGKGTRMKSNIPKVLHKILGKPMIEYVIEEVKKILFENIFVIVGYKKDEVKSYLEKYDLNFIIQEPQLGTGHAIMQAIPYIKDFDKDILILNGDMPLITSEILEDFLKFHKEKNANLSIVTAYLDNPFGYGRIIRENGKIIRIVEEKDAKEEEKKIKEMNAGVYCFNAKILEELVNLITNNTAQKEFYLTDCVKLAVNKNLNVEGFKVDSEYILGINTKEDLARIEEIIRKKILKELMLKGVIIKDPSSTYIEKEVEIGIDTVIFPQTYIIGKSKIGENCFIGPFCWIENTEIGNNVRIEGFSHIVESKIYDFVKIGPFCRIRPLSEIKEYAKLGNFVEVKKSIIGKGSKANHLSYIGDTEMGENVNIGAGTITCNYDGKRKHKTIIEDNAFIGSDTQLVAPIKIGKYAFIGAGSTITKDVPPYALALARARQVNIKDWVKRKFLKDDK